MCVQIFVNMTFVINSCTASFCIVHDECARDLPQVLACVVPGPTARLVWHSHDFVTKCLPVLTILARDPATSHWQR